MFKAALIFLPALKNGTRFSATSTLAPVFGFLAKRGLRVRTDKTPKPRNSTRLPSLKAFVISLKSYEAKFRGSTNQRIIDVKKTLETGNAVIGDI